MDYLRANDLLSPQMIPLAERYVRCLSRARKFYAQAEAKPWATGSMGQQVAHPAFKLAREAEQDAHRYAEALYLTPKSAREAGLTEAVPGEHADIGI